MHGGRKLGGAALAAVCLGILLMSQSGCAMLNGFLDPTKVGAFPQEYQEVGIRQVLSPRDTPSGLANSTDPEPRDVVVVRKDYRLTAGDTVQVIIEDLIGQGVPYAADLRVSDTGYLRISRVGTIKAMGRTEAELEEEIERRIIEGARLVEPIVQVTATSRNARSFNIFGSVGQPATYPIPRPDFRLTDALGLARDVGAEVRTLYVIRRNPEALEGLETTVDPATAPAPADDDGLIIPPPVEGDDTWSMPPLSASLISYQQTETQPAEPEADDDMRRLRDVMEGERGDQDGGDFEPIVIDPGTQAPVEPRPADEPTVDVEAPELDLEALDDAPFAWDDVPTFENYQRVLKIDVRALRTGDPRYNIVIRNQDSIWAPIDTGVFYMMGEVRTPGVFAFGGRPITIKQAIALAGGFTPLAWPSRCEIIRREPGTDRQITYSVNLDAIFANLEDDLELRDNDIVNVGTHIVSPFLFVIRNSFRFTYGFGFVYDRNFADIDSFEGKQNPDTIRRQREAQLGLPF